MKILILMITFLFCFGCPSGERNIIEEIRNSNLTTPILGKPDQECKHWSRHQLKGETVYVGIVGESNQYRFYFEFLLRKQSFTYSVHHRALETIKIPSQEYELVSLYLETYCSATL